MGMRDKILVDFKSCTQCERHLPISEFYANKRAKDGHGTWCKPCWLGIGREYAKTPVGAENNKAKSARHYRKHTSKHIAYTQTPNGRFNSYRTDARHRNGGMDFSITKDEFMLFWQKPCFYCGDSIPTVGLDRVDNSKGYVLGNIASCCSICNFAKRQLGRNEFIEHCRKVIVEAEKRKIKTEGDNYARSCIPG